MSEMPEQSHIENYPRIKMATQKTTHTEKLPQQFKTFDSFLG